MIFLNQIVINCLRVMINRK